MNTTHQHRTRSADSLPRARTVKYWWPWMYWLIPLGAALLAGFYIYTEIFSRKPDIHVLFEDAQDLEPGKSEVKYRGTQIGTVKEIKLTPDHRHADLTLALNKSARDVAREGSQFWIVRAQIGVGSIEAPGTLVSGNFVTVEPGNGKPATKFDGFSEAPMLETPGDLNIVLLTEKLGSLKKRSPVFYRGITVGQVREYDLGTNSQTVTVTLQIQKDFAPLVRMNSKFWNAGGLDVNIGLHGADISAQSAQALVSGGVSFATPDITQEPAPTNTSFRLYDRPEDVWLSWSPAIKLDRHAAAPQETAHTHFR